VYGYPRIENISSEHAEHLMELLPKIIEENPLSISTLDPDQIRLFKKGGDIPAKDLIPDLHRVKIIGGGSDVYKKTEWEAKSFARSKRDSGHFVLLFKNVPDGGWDEVEF